MPQGIITEVLNNLPVQLFSSLDKLEVYEKRDRYKSAGLTCTINPIVHKEHMIELHQLAYDDEVIRLLSNFFSEKDLPTNGKHWTSPYALPTILADYMEYHLERLDCTYEIKQA